MRCSMLIYQAKSNTGHKVCREAGMSFSEIPDMTATHTSFDPIIGDMVSDSY